MQEDKQQSAEAGNDSPVHVEQNFQADHPGRQEMSKNPNPRANENLPDETVDKDKVGGGTTTKAGSEITDGEAG